MYLSSDTIFVTVICSTTEDTDSPIFEETEFLSQKDTHKPSILDKLLLWSNVPEVIFEESWIKVQCIRVKIEISGSFSIISIERISSFFGPDVHHLSNSYGEGVCENGTHPSTE